MAMAGGLTVLLFCLIVSTQAKEQQPSHGRRSKRDFMASMASFLSNVDKRLAAVEARFDNGTEERLARLEAKMEEEVEEKKQDVEEKLKDVEEKQQNMKERLQAVQDGMQRLESMVLELLNTRLESMVTEILTSKMAATEQKMTQLEDKTNATEERLASLETSNTETQSSPASCRYQYLYRYEKEAPSSSADLLRVTKLETELTKLQEKVSALDNHQQDNDLSRGSLHNASLVVMEGVVHSVTELVAASDQNLQLVMQNTTEIMASLMSNLEARLLAAVENKLDNATSLLAEELENTRTRCNDVQRQTEGPTNRTSEADGTEGYRRTCQDYYEHGQRSSGTYTLLLEDGQSPLEVYCDMSNGTGWVVFQRRQNGSMDFYRNWTSYEDGFGDLSGEFWLGNRNIHSLTNAGLTQLRVDLQAWNGSTAFASYSHFSVGDASSSYRLSVSGYSGTAGDSLTYHNNQKFSTFDQDNDSSDGTHCAQDTGKGAWWYNKCDYSNLNGQYATRGSNGRTYVVWYHWLGDQSLQRTELKLK